MSDFKGTKTPTATRRSSFAAAVSRTLREGGVQTRPGSAPRNREGVRVSQQSDTSARVVADFNYATDRIAMAEAAAKVLQAAGYLIDRTGDERHQMIVSREPKPRALGPRQQKAAATEATMLWAWALDLQAAVKTNDVEEAEKLLKAINEASAGLGEKLAAAPEQK